MSRKDKASVIERQVALAKRMRQSNGYQEDYNWYYNNYGMSEKTYQHDRTVIYDAWKLEANADIEDKKIEYINSLKSDREAAREFGQFAVSINATKLMAQIDGVLNKQNDVAVTVNNLGIDLSKFSIDELKKLL